jgi:hypothetical protein
MYFRSLSHAFALVAAGVCAAPVHARCADLALVLAIDGSGSISDRDYDLQRIGYAAAFAGAEVQRALASAGVVDVAVVLWGDSELSPQILPWQRIVTPADAIRLADRIADAPRTATGNTGIGRGLWTALDLIEASQACAARRLINVSGDGTETKGPRSRHFVDLRVARARAVGMGVTINGLAITSDFSGLESWYRDHVITGPGAFVIVASDFNAFGEAISRKLTREIALPSLAFAAQTQEPTP